MVIIKENHKTTNTTSTINDMKNTFRDRYNKLKKIIIDEHQIKTNLHSIKTIINKADAYKKIDPYKDISPNKLGQILTKNKDYLKNMISGNYAFKKINKNIITLYDIKKHEDIKIDIYMSNKHQRNILLSLYEILNKTHSLKNISIIQDIKRTKKGNYIITCEDGTSTVDIHNSKYKKINTIDTFCTPETLKDSGITPETLIRDQVIYQEIKFVDYPIRGSQLQRDKLQTIHIKQPSLQKQQKTINKDTHIVFLSDIHIGSKYFNESKFVNTINYINTHDVNAVLIAGDIVDGIGIYPRQEDDLHIHTFREQYEKLAEYLNLIEAPIYITPGNHDAVPLKEPQQPLNETYAKPLCQNKNITMLSNPATIEINNITIKMYHGKGFDDLIMAMKTLDYQKPCDVMCEQLEKRHLAPLYGMTTQHAFEGEDNLVIDTLPDILHTGHVHIAQHKNYKGIELINSGTFQNQTPFQQTHKINPTVGRIPILKDGHIEMIQM